MTKGVVHINIEIEKHNCFKDLTHKIFDWLEDLMFSVFQKLPETMIPQFLMNWMDGYTKKRLSELQQQLIRDRWYTVELEKFVDHISNEQHS